MLVSGAQLPRFDAVNKALVINQDVKFELRYLIANVERLVKGVQGILFDFQRSQNLKKKRKLNGEKSLTYSEFKFLEEYSKDSSKLFRLMITIPLSPEFFFYSYLLYPMFFSGNNPWAWNSFPSSFLFPEEEFAKRDVLSKRRLQLLVQGISELKSIEAEKIVDEDNRSPNSNSNFRNPVEVIEQALKSKNLDESLKILDNWFAFQQVVSAANSKSSSKAAQVPRAVLKDIPWGITNGLCKAFGIDALPNVYFIRRFNLAEVSKYLDQIRLGDNYLTQVGVQSLSDDEVSYF